MKFFKYIPASILLASPVLLNAQETLADAVTCEGFDCNFDHLLVLIRSVLLFLFRLSVPIAAIALAVAGFKILTARDNANERTEAKTMMLKIVGGVMIMLAAGLIVNTIVGELLTGDYNFLD